MELYEAEGFITATKRLLTAAAGGSVDAEALVSLEKQAAGLLKSERGKLRIITSEPSGRGDDPTHPSFNRLEPVAEVEETLKEKVIERGGKLQKVTYTYYLASGGDAWTGSGPEGFAKVDGKLEPYGAASALLARLLEAYVAGGV